MRQRWGFFNVIVILFLSCHSNQVYENNLIDYSDTNDANKTYNIGIAFSGKDIASLKQNIVNAIIQNNGDLLQEQTENINTHRLTVNIPKNKTMTFMKSIKSLGVVINESKGSQDISSFDVQYKNRLENAQYMLGKYNNLLEAASTVSDKITLEKEIMSTEREIEMIENNRKSMELRREYNTVSLIIYNK